MSTDEVEMVAVFIEKLNIINIVIYRPPGTKGIFFFGSTTEGEGNIKKSKDARTHSSDNW